MVKISKPQFSGKKPSLYLCLSLVAALTLYNLFNMFVPFATYSRTQKIFSTLIGFAILCVLLYWLYQRVFAQKIRTLGTNWWQYTLFALILGSILWSLTYAHPPMYPAQKDIQVSTKSGLGFMQINRQLGNGYSSYEGYSQLNGDWVNGNGFISHQGSDEGTIDYRGMEFVTSELSYLFIFIPQSQPAFAQVRVDKDIFDLQIPSSQAHKGVYPYTVNVPDRPAVTSFWQAWINIYPMMRWLFLVVFFFFSSLDQNSECLHLQALIEKTSARSYQYLVYQCNQR